MMDIYYTLLAIAACLVVALAYIVEREDNDFSWLDMLRNEDGKPSFLRLGIPFAGAVSTLLVLYVVREHFTDAATFFVAYLSAWSGLPIAGKALDSLANLR